MKLYLFRTVRLPIIRSLFTVHSAMVNVIQLSRGTRMELQVCCGPSRKLWVQCLYDIPLSSVQWISSWWWTDELSETNRVSWQNKFVKLVHPVGFITKKFVTMHVTSHERKILSISFDLKFIGPTYRVLCCPQFLRIWNAMAVVKMFHNNLVSSNATPFPNNSPYSY
jgi:hypothetical protein